VSDAVQPSPLWCPQEGLVVAFSGDMGGGTLVAVRPGGRGDVTDGRRAWIQRRVKGSIGTGVAHAGRLYAISGDGFVLCHDLKTGRKLWQKRLEATGDKGSSWSSMLLAGDRIYAPNQGGDVFVLKAGREFDVLATNSVNEPTNASLAASGGQLFLRTDKALWCIGK
jgi:outer membrane protein assembly factor BamB